MMAREKPQLVVFSVVRFYAAHKAFVGDSSVLRAAVQGQLLAGEEIYYHRDKFVFYNSSISAANGTYENSTTSEEGSQTT